MAANTTSWRCTNKQLFAMRFATVSKIIANAKKASRTVGIKCNPLDSKSKSCYTKTQHTESLSDNNVVRFV